MNDRGGSSRFSSVQEIGGAPDEAQTDRIRAGEVRTASGRRVLLAVVADGSGAGGGEAAARVVEQVFQVVEQSRPRELAAALQRGLQIADQGLLKATGQAAPGAGVAATAAAIWRNRVYFAHIGHTLAFHVSNGRAKRLTQPSADRLGAADSPQIQAGRLQLQRGDRIVVASDGLMRPNSETGKAYVEQAEIAEHVAELPPREAGRHLVSLALGRDVDDNVSVAILSLRAAAQTQRGFPWATIAVGSLALVVVAVAAALLLNLPSAPSASDYGFAVLIEGDLLADQGSGTPELVASLGTIPSRSVVTASTDAKLGLQSTIDVDAGVADSALFLEQSAQLELTAIDPRAAAGGQSIPPPAQGTDLTLAVGRVLVLRDSGTWEFRVHHRDFTASLIGAGRGAMGVAADGGSFSLACLVGTCRMSGGGQRVLLQAGELVSGQGSSLAEPGDLAVAAVEQWDLLCEGCALLRR